MQLVPPFPPPLSYMPQLDGLAARVLCAPITDSLFLSRFPYPSPPALPLLCTNALP
jgi:hypothetical protein